MVRIKTIFKSILIVLNVVAALAIIFIGLVTYLEEPAIRKVAPERPSHIPDYAKWKPFGHLGMWYYCEQCNDENDTVRLIQYYGEEDLMKRSGLYYIEKKEVNLDSLCEWVSFPSNTDIYINYKIRLKPIQGSFVDSSLKQ